MSNISNRHTVLSYQSGESKPLTGQRLAVISYKSRTDKTGKVSAAKYPSICISIPPVDIADATDVQMEALHNALNTWMASHQDNIIRSLYEGSDGSLSSISDSDIGIDAVISYLTSTSTGGKLSKDGIGSWFDTSLAEELSILIAGKLGFSDLTEDNMVVVGKKVAAYKDMIMGLSAPTITYSPSQLTALSTAIGMVQDTMADRLVARIKAVMDAPKVEDLLEL